MGGRGGAGTGPPKFCCIKILLHQNMLLLERLTDLAVLIIEVKLLGTVDFNDILHDFANTKARKVFFRVLQTFILIILFY